MKTLSRYRIKKLQNEIYNQINYINRGGCGWFAFFMANKLEKEKIPYKIKVINYSESEFLRKKNNLNNYFNNNDKKGLNITSFSHCYLEVDNGKEKLKFDGEHFITGINEDYPLDWYGYTGEYSLKELEVALKYGGWNERYDKKQNRDLQKLVNNII